MRRFLLLALFLGGASIAAPALSRAEDVTFVTDFGINGRHAYFFVAQDRGY